VDIAGGLPETIADAPGGRGGTWSEDGTIIFTPNGLAPISKVVASGGAVTPLTTLDASREENAHYWPSFLPGGKRYLYFARSSQVENSGIYLGHMDGSPAVRLVASFSSGFVATNTASNRSYLLWARDNDLLAQPFDVGTATLSGEAVKITGDVRVEESQRLTCASASRNGHLVWASARAAEIVLAVYARDGRRLRELEIPPGVYTQPTFSPDGTRVLFVRVDRGSADIFVHDLGSGATERLTTSPEYDDQPNWTPDGRAMTYLGQDGKERAGFRLALGGGTPLKQVAALRRAGLESRDGRYLIVSQSNSKSGLDIVAHQLDGEGKPVPLLERPGNDAAVAQTADGRWMLILQQTGARVSIAIARLWTDGPKPVLGTPQILAEDTVGAALRADGREVVVTTLDGTVKAISLNPADDRMTVGATTVLFRLPRNTPFFTVHPAGTEFIVRESPFEAGQDLRVLTRWDERLKNR
jgi:eukaryotic-like serine/threonine-protein kinase